MTAGLAAVWMARRTKTAKKTPASAAAATAKTMVISMAPVELDGGGEGGINRVGRGSSARHGDNKQGVTRGGVVARDHSRRMRKHPRSDNHCRCRSARGARNQLTAFNRQQGQTEIEILKGGKGATAPAATTLLRCATLREAPQPHPQIRAEIRILTRFLITVYT